MSGHALIHDVPDATIRLGILCGLMRIADDGIAEFTPKGEQWFQAWLSEQQKRYAMRLGFI